MILHACSCPLTARVSSSHALVIKGTRFMRTGRLVRWRDRQAVCWDFPCSCSRAKAGPAAGHGAYCRVARDAQHAPPIIADRCTGQTEQLPNQHLKLLLQSLQRHARHSRLLINPRNHNNPQAAEPSPGARWPLAGVPDLPPITLLRGHWINIDSRCTGP